MPKSKSKNRRDVDYYDENFTRREGRVLERNGNLTYIEDVKTGKADWYSPHEIGEKW